MQRTEAVERQGFLGRLRSLLPGAERRRAIGLTPEIVRARRLSTEAGEQVNYRVITELIVDKSLATTEDPQVAKIKLWGIRSDEDEGWYVRAVKPDRESTDPVVIYGEVFIPDGSPDKVHDAGYQWVKNSYPNGSASWTRKVVNEGIRDKYLEATSLLRQ
ncbi:MAG: hypothetical protein UU21_C0004G0006 [Candidatus Levybacteria bacterium GW2011_GWA2_40_8]|nr:MAG: hypothetical protein UU21_C0004G0006 [Candidatus Levybacteria bacterium GW2011_GWA2_40_8]